MTNLIQSNGAAPTSINVDCGIRWFGNRREHLCRICQKWGEWGDGWGWYGSYKDFEDGRPVVKWCSDSCGALLALNGYVSAAEAFAGDPMDALDDTPKGRR